MNQINSVRPYKHQSAYNYKQ